MLRHESVEQIKLFDWIKRSPYNDYAFHIPNDAKRTPQQGRILRRMGLVTGIPDVFIAWPTATHHGLFIELKHGTNKASEAQDKRLKLFMQKGYYCVLAYGADAAIAAIEHYANENVSLQSDIYPIYK